MKKETLHIKIDQTKLPNKMHLAITAKLIEGINMVIYKITNKLNSKIYIGKTIKTSAERWKCHVLEAFNKNQSIYNSPFHKAIRKYGKENFIVEDIDFAIDEAELNTKEKYWIQQFRTILGKNLMYNLAEGGNGGCTRGKGWHHTTETKQKLRANHNPNSNKCGRIPSEVTRRKISKANKGQNNGMYGKHHDVSFETKQKISEAHKGKKLTDEHKQKLSESHKGKAKGKVSIHKEIVVKYVHVEELDEYLNNGWLLGTGRFKN